ncbi:hypothetical protein FSP39_015132 [Pinctada imbricata]|uniref:Uncharacterized protein n=1 Tax=Pinctada imbricata TaxID=66713 RepID=A0AA89BYR6_PINIB|nr:hypothetical protein FSP39_015132 [Pinctada imbricata]
MAANLNSPVQLKNAKFSPSRNGELEVIVDRSTSLEMVKQKLDFKKKKLDPPQQSILKSLSDLTEENMLVTLNVKLLNFTNEETEVYTRYGAKSVRNAIIADKSGTKTISFWGNIIPSVKQGSFYNLTNVVSKKFDENITLSTTTNTKALQIPIFDEVKEEDVPIQHAENIVITSINVITSYRCSNKSCSATFPIQELKGTFMKCSTCKMKQKVENIIKSTSAKAVCKTETDSNKQILISQQALENCLGEENNELMKDEDALEDHILTVENFRITTGNNREICIKLESA